MGTLNPKLLKPESFVVYPGAVFSGIGIFFRLQSFEFVVV